MAKPLVLLDSDICIYLIEGLSEAARNAIESYAPGEVVTSSIAFAEVMRGVTRNDERAGANAEAFFAVVPVLPFDRAAGAAYRDVPFRRGSFDQLIAAHALSLGLILVTNNERDFREVAGLRVENWTLP